MRRFVALCLIIFLTACGKTKGPHDRESYPMLARAEQEGYFRAPLSSVNNFIGNRASGLASVFLKGNQFYAKVKLSTGRRHVTHLQGIHAGSRCPTQQDDENGDGLVDGEEVLKVVGRMLIPLDGDLSRQLKEFSIWPNSGRKGEYLYARSTGVRNMMSELRTFSYRAHRLLARLGPSQELHLAHRVVIVYGMPFDQGLPVTAKGFGGYPPHMSIPVACGRFIETGEEFPFIQ